MTQPPKQLYDLRAKLDHLAHLQQTRGDSVGQLMYSTLALGVQLAIDKLVQSERQAQDGVLETRPTRRGTRGSR